MGMIEKAGVADLERGLGEERRGWRPQALLVARSRFESSALTYKPGEKAKTKH